MTWPQPVSTSRWLGAETNPSAHPVARSRMTYKQDPPPHPQGEACFCLARGTFPVSVAVRSSLWGGPWLCDPSESPQSRPAPYPTPTSSRRMKRRQGAESCSGTALPSGRTAQGMRSLSHLPPAPPSSTQQSAPLQAWVPVLLLSMGDGQVSHSSHIPYSGQSCPQVMALQRCLALHQSNPTSP